MKKLFGITPASRWGIIGLAAFISACSPEEGLPAGGGQCDTPGAACGADNTGVCRSDGVCVVGGCTPAGSACGPNNRGVCRADLTCFDPGAPSPDMGGPSEGFVVVSTCSTPTNVRFTNGGFGGADGWATVRLNDTGATQDKAVDQPNFGTDTRSIANMRAGICAVLLRWPGMGNGAAPPNGALTDLPHVGLNNVSAYWLDTGPTNFGWAHDNRHRR